MSSVDIVHAYTFHDPTDPNFHPHNVSAWPLSGNLLHVQWMFNATMYQKILQRMKLNLTSFLLSITEASRGLVVVNDSISINYQRCVLLFTPCPVSLGAVIQTG